ncbi:unnamed protein product, partial [Callosobruchus maculatus]
SVCAFPYVIAFTSNSMEIRLIVNGNLIHTMTMPKLQLIASKNDIFFCTTAPEFFPNKTDRLLMVDVRQQELQKHSPPSSPNASPDIRPLRIYRIPLHALSRPSAAVHNHPSTTASSATPVWRSADSKLAPPPIVTGGATTNGGSTSPTPDATTTHHHHSHVRVSRSATSSPIPPNKAKAPPNVK